ncbi:MAG: hypothetical protein ACQES9_10610 [Myxococcota bacterium]
MMSKQRFILRLSATIIAMATIGFSWSCIDRPMEKANPAPDVVSDFSAVQGGTRDVDMLFVIDNSLSMAQEQTTVRNNFSVLMRVLKNVSGGLPNVHIGVISTDLGTLPHNLPSCVTPDGDNGKILKGENNACANPVGQNYIVDVEAKNCDIQKDDEDTRICIQHGCDDSHCQIEGEPSGLILYEDENGCPRCRNYEGETLEEVFSCTADLNIHGCGFEQHLEALYRAFTEEHVENAGFFRENAYIAIFFITDEDDCSTTTGNIFNPDGDIDSTLGPLDSFRCTEFGIKCDEPWDRQPPGGNMTMHNCKARTVDDDRAYLYPISRYNNLMTEYYDPRMIIIGAIAGPYDDTLTVQVDSDMEPMLGYCCYASGESEDGAVPGVRIKEFVEAFVSSEDDMNWAYTSVCNGDYSPALEGLGNKIKDLVEVQCITTPLNGCPDPAAANGLDPITQLDSKERDVCEPNCSVYDVNPDGSVNEIELCAAESGPDNDGHPPKIWDGLEEPCYHVTYNEKCDNGSTHSPSRGAEIIISRKENPPLGTSAKITCQGFPLQEKLCYDGEDNDFDGLTDGSDPDCQ